MKNSPTRIRTAVVRVKAEYPDQLDYRGLFLYEVHSYIFNTKSFYRFERTVFSISFPLGFCYKLCKARLCEVSKLTRELKDREEKVLNLNNGTAFMKMREENLRLEKENVKLGKDKLTLQEENMQLRQKIMENIHDKKQDKLNSPTGYNYLIR
jgi:hypothetical protein